MSQELYYGVNSGLFSGLYLADVCVHLTVFCMRGWVSLHDDKFTVVEGYAPRTSQK